jgi:hypothetical protein
MIDFVSQALDHRLLRFLCIRRLNSPPIRRHSLGLCARCLTNKLQSSLSQGEDPGEIRAKSQRGTQQDDKRGSAVKECNDEVKVLRQRK